MDAMNDLADMVRRAPPDLEALRAIAANHNRGVDQAPYIQGDAVIVPIAGDDGIELVPVRSRNELLRVLGY